MARHGFSRVISFSTLILVFLLFPRQPAMASGSIAQAKLLPDNTPVSLTAKVVTFHATDFFYIEDDNRVCGIRVEKSGHGLVLGMRADVSGTLQTNSDRERYIAASLVSHNGDGSLAPMAVTTQSVGGSDWNHLPATGDGQQGTWMWRWVKQPDGLWVRKLTETPGLNNLGLLVRICGKVRTYVAGSFYLDDGSRCDDFMDTVSDGPAGVRILLPPGVNAPPVGAYVQVTGISSCINSTDGPRRLLLLRSYTDLTSPDDVSPSDYSQIRQLEADAGTMLLDFLNLGVPVEQALAQVAAWSAGQGVVESAVVASEGTYLCLTFRSGQGTILAVETDGQTAQSLASAGAQCAMADWPPPILTATAGAQGESLVASNKSALLYCFRRDLYTPDLCERLLNYGYGWPYNAGEKPYFAPDKPSVSDFAQIGQYSFVQITTHSYSWDNKNDPSPPLPFALCTEETAPSPPSLEWPSLAVREWKSGRVLHELLIVPGLYSYTGNWYYAVTTKFIKQHPLTFPSIIVLQTCYGYPEFTNAFRDAGATTVLGWATEGDRKYAESLIPLFEAVCPTDPETQPKTLKEAWETSEAKNVWGLELVSGDPGATPIPILDTAEIDSKTEANARSDTLVLKGRFGADNVGRAAFIPLPEDGSVDPKMPASWQTPGLLDPVVGQWTKEEASFDVSWAPSGNAAVRVWANGILSNVKRVAVPIREWPLKITHWRGTDDGHGGQIVEKLGEDNNRTLPYKDALAVMVNGEIWLYFSSVIGFGFSPPGAMFGPIPATPPLNTPVSAEAIVELSSNFGDLYYTSDTLAYVQFSCVDWSGFGKISGTVGGTFQNSGWRDGTTYYWDTLDLNMAPFTCRR